MKSRRILTVGLHASVDVSYVVEQFDVGRTHRVSEVTRVAGGKGNNVARVLSTLGLSVVATGFAGGDAGRFIVSDLQNRGIETSFEECQGENRTCTSVVDPVTRSLTELREPGPILTPREAGRFLTRFARLVSGVDLVVLSGSLPQGIPDDFYAQLVRTAYRSGQVRCIVDAAGGALRAVLCTQPYMVKPNLEELEEWAQSPLSGSDDIVRAAHELRVAGPLVVAVSLGRGGLLLVSPEGTWKVTPPLILPLNTVGCGDSLVAGFAAGLIRNLSAEEILRQAVASGTASALTPSVATLDPDEMGRLREHVVVERIG